MSTKVWMILGSIFLAGQLGAQSFKYSIEVMDSLSGDRLENAILVDSKGQFLTETAYRGRGWFESDRERIFARVHHPAYQSKSVYLSHSMDMKTILLVPRAVATDSVVVMAQRQIKSLSSSYLQEVELRRRDRSENFMPGASTVQEALSKIAQTQLNIDPVTGSSVNVSGLGAENVKILLDGQPITGRINGAVDLDQFSLQNIQDIQVYFGPQSIIYGSDVSGGLINLISFYPNQKKLGGNLTGIVRSTKQYNMDASLDFGLGKNRFNLGLGRHYFDGKRLYDTMLRQYNWLPKEQYFTNLNWNRNWTSAKQRRVFLHWNNQYYRELLYAPGEPILIHSQHIAYAFDNRYHTQRFNSGWCLRILAKKWAHELQGNYSDFDRSTQKFYKNFVTHERKEIYDSTTTGDRFSLVQGRYILSRRQSAYESQNGLDYLLEKGEGAKIAGVREREEIGAFSMWKFHVNSWNFIPALRYNIYRLWENQWIPALEINNKISENWYFEVGYNKAYRIPSLKEMYLDFVDINHDIQGNPDLQPEQTHAAHAGFRFDYAGMQSAFGAKLNIAYNNLQDKIALTQVDSANLSYTYFNVSEVQNTVLSLDLEWEPYWDAGRWKLRSSAQNIYYLKYAGTKNANMLTTTLNLNWTSDNEKWTANTNLKAVIDQRVFVGEVDVLKLRTLENYLLLDLGMQRTWKQLCLGMGVRNLANVQQVKFKDGLGTGTGGVHSGSGNGMLRGLGRDFYLRVSYDF